MVKYDVTTKKFSELKDKIEIPKFQRGLVWNKTKKKEFIKTLKAGLPIGVLLVSKKDDKYLVIDGLQRFTTMKDYSRDYFAYIDKSEITDLDLHSIVLASPSAREIFDAYTSDAKQREFDAMRNIIAEKISNGYGQNLNQISLNATSELCKKIAAIPSLEMMEVLGAVYIIVERIANEAKIDDIEIPLIIFKGKEDELADIFQKLNQEGVRLSKYDVFAATWINKYVTVKNDPLFIDFIINKYELAQEESDLDISSYDPEEMKQKGELTVFEYAYAVGKALKAKCKKLFPKDNESKVDSIGFLILAELMGLTYQNMGKLAETIEKHKNLDFKQFKDAILEAGMFVENVLSSYIESPMRSKSGVRASLACHSELQLASYIIVVFKLKYDLSVENGLSQKPKSKELQRIRDFLHKHYLYDILQGYWAGSGDSKLEEIIADPTICRYTKDVDKNDFEMVIVKWLMDGNKKATLTNVSADTKLFLNYLLRTSGSFDEKVNYDVEHCVPKDVIKKYYLKKNITVPMSAPCNLVYIPTADNRSKGDMTYYQRQASDPGTFLLNEKQLDFLCYPNKQELSFVEATAKITEANYFSFLDSRKNSIVNRFINAIYK